MFETIIIVALVLVLVGVPAAFILSELIRWGRAQARYERLRKQGQVLQPRAKDCQRPKLQGRILGLLGSASGELSRASDDLFRAERHDKATYKKVCAQLDRAEEQIQEALGLLRGYQGSCFQQLEEDLEQATELAEQSEQPPAAARVRLAKQLLEKAKEDAVVTEEDPAGSVLLEKVRFVETHRALQEAVSLARGKPLPGSGVSASPQGDGKAEVAPGKAPAGTLGGGTNSGDNEATTEYRLASEPEVPAGKSKDAKGGSGKPKPKLKPPPKK